MTDLCFRSCVIMAMCLFLFGVAAGNAWAADKVYKRGQDKTITVNCDNPTTRVDGTPLTLEEIDSVEFYIAVPAADGGFTGNPLLTIVMQGGCMAAPVDLQILPVNTEMGLYAKTVDTGGLESIVGSGPTLIVRSANPNAPGQIR